MSKIKVDEITNKLDDGPVYFPRGVTGDASKMTLRPGVETFTPNQLATGVAIDSNIQIGFNQDMTFSGVGTITIRQDSISGTVFEEFTCGVSAGATITGNVLTIIPTTDFAFGTTYFVSLPSAGIANTIGGFISSLSNYQFTTEPPAYSASGGDYVFTVFNPGSPTNYYKYHIFTNPGILTSNSASADDPTFYMMMVGGGGAGGAITFNDFNVLPAPEIREGSTGGGGGGGVVEYTGTAANLTTGDATITVGAGGQAHNTYGPASPYDNSTPTGQQGQNTVLVTPTFTYTVEGGGCGGTNAPTATNSNPATVPNPQYGVDPKFYEKGQPGGSGGGGAIRYTQPAPTPNPGGPGIPGQGAGGGRATRYTGPGPQNIVTARSGGGGGSSGSGGNGTIHPNPGPLSYYYGVKHGNGGTGKLVPEFPVSDIIPRIPFGPTIAPRATSSYYGGGGAAGGAGGSPTLSYIGSNYGGSGGGGDPAVWYTTSFYPPTQGGSEPIFNPRGIPADGCQMLGGGGAGGHVRTSNPSAPAAARAGAAGNGGPGCVMVRYAHPGP